MRRAVLDGYYTCALCLLKVTPVLWVIAYHGFDIAPPAIPRLAHRNSLPDFLSRITMRPTSSNPARSIMHLTACTNRLMRFSCSVSSRNEGYGVGS